MGDDSFGINSTVVQSFANQIQTVVSSGLQICIVVGGGNIYRGCLLYTSPSPRD